MSLSSLSLGRNPQADGGKCQRGSGDPDKLPQIGRPQPQVARALPGANSRRHDPSQRHPEKNLLHRVDRPLRNQNQPIQNDELNKFARF